MLTKDAGTPIQGMPLGRGNAVSPYTVLDTDNVIEFIDDGDVNCTLSDGTITTTTVLGGSRYSISSDVKNITFSGTFNVS